MRNFEAFTVYVAVKIKCYQNDLKYIFSWPLVFIQIFKYFGSLIRTCKHLNKENRGQNEYAF